MKTPRDLALEVCSEDTPAWGIDLVERVAERLQRAVLANIAGSIAGSTYELDLSKFEERLQYAIQHGRQRDVLITDEGLHVVPIAEDALKVLQSRECWAEIVSQIADRLEALGEVTYANPFDAVDAIVARTHAMRGGSDDRPADSGRWPGREERRPRAAALADGVWAPARGALHCDVGALLHDLLRE